MAFRIPCGALFSLLVLFAVAAMWRRALIILAFACMRVTLPAFMPIVAAIFAAA